MSLLESALWYRKEMGFSLIPVRSDAPSKDDRKPFVKFSEFMTRKTTEDEIRDWWTRWPNAGIGVLTGKINGISVIDLDYSEMHNGERDLIESMIPETLLTPAVTTPRGNTHLWFEYDPDLPHIANMCGIKGFDGRNDTNYIVAPPSPAPPFSKIDKYSWKEGLDLKVKTQLIPSDILKYIKTHYSENNIRQHAATSDNILAFQEGSRDATLFHVANCLVKGGMPQGETRQVIEILAGICNPPYPENEVKSKVNSALERANRRERNFTNELRQLCLTTSGNISTTDIINLLQPTTFERRSLSVVMARICEEGLAEKQGKRAGCWRIKDKECPSLDWWNVSTEEFPMRLPLGIHELTEMVPKSIIVVAGIQGGGKTVFMMETLLLNMDSTQIKYVSSETGERGFNKRITSIPGCNEQWMQKFGFYHKTSGFQDVVEPEKLNIIDYLEIHTNFYEVGSDLAAIFDKLTTGVAVVGLQKTGGSQLGRGGSFSLEKPEVYISIDYYRDDKGKPVRDADGTEYFEATIEKARTPKGNRHPRGLKRVFTQSNGSKTHPKTEWTYEEKAYGKA